MGSIKAADLMVEGIGGIGEIFCFALEERPGEHGHAEAAGRALHGAVFGELAFTYRLAEPEWAGQRRTGNRKLPGLSLLGTVASREGETVCLDLDIDEGCDRGHYPFQWAPATGNLMYLVPSVGSRVSLYFKGNEETGAVAVNCVRREGEGGGNAWQERSLAAEGGKELKLHPRSLGLYSVDSRVKLDDLEGISIEGKGSLRIAAAGQVRIEGSEVDLQADAFHFYQGDLKVSRGGEASFSKKGELHLEGEGGPLTASVLAKSTALLGYEPEDYSGGQYRFRDDPLEEGYDWAGLTVRVTACVAGMMVTDAIQGRVSGMEEYVRAALSGSIIGAMTGAQNSCCRRWACWGISARILRWAVRRAPLNRYGWTGK